MVIFQMANSPVKECEVSMLDIRHVVAIVLLLINGLWKIIRSGCDYRTLEKQLQVLSLHA